jgi:hypothetical protein
VASDSGPLPERILGGRTGLLVPAGDAAALGGALAALLDDTDRRAELGAAGRDHATRAAHPDGLASRLDEVYAAAARRWRRPARPRRSGSGRSAPAREASRARAADDRMAVFMPTFQCRRWLPRAIEAVLGQTWRPLDLYVADDASGDAGDAPERLLDPAPEHGARGRIAHHREPVAELEPGDELGLAALQAVLDRDPAGRRDQQPAIVGIAKLAGEQPAQGVERHHRPPNIGRRLSNSLR